MRFKTKNEVIKAYSDGKLAKWELKPILDNIKFEKNTSEIAKLCFKYIGDD